MRDDFVDEVNGLAMGDVTDFSNFMGAVIDNRSFDRLAGVLERVRGEAGVEILAGGTADDSEGYFVRPTSELSRVLRPGGPAGITDITADGSRLPAQLTSQAAWVACVARRPPARGIRRMLTATGLPVTRMERHDAAAARMIDQIAAPAHRRPADRARPGGGAWPRLRPGRTGARRREDRTCRGHHRIRPAGRGETGVSRDDHDLVVIGGGLGAARAAVHRCAATLLVSDGEPGGDCTYCAPSKTLIESARRGLPFTTAAQPVRDVVAAIAATENAAALRGEGIDVALGRAASTAPGRITVAGRPIGARRFVVATGSRPSIPPIPAHTAPHQRAHLRPPRTRGCSPLET